MTHATHNRTHQQEDWEVVGHEDEDDALGLLVYLRAGQRVEGKGSGLWFCRFLDIIEALFDLGK